MSEKYMKRISVDDADSKSQLALHKKQAEKFNEHTRNWLFFSQSNKSVDNAYQAYTEDEDEFKSFSQLNFKFDTYSVEK